MNRFIGLLITVVAIAALAGAAIGWRFPFPGRSRTANQIGTAPETTQNQPTSQARPLRANQPTAQAQNNNPTTAQTPDATVNPESTANTQSAQSESSQPVQALW